MSRLSATIATTTASTGEDASVRWVDASREPSFEQFRPLLAGLAALIVGSIGVAYRVYLCRAPAFVALAIGALAGSLYLRAKARRRERSIKTIRAVYSLDHADRVRAALAVGAHVLETRSNYERLHYERCRTWLLLTLWVLWLFYGAVFHSGEHAPSEDALLVDLTGIGTDVPHLARIARLYLLALNSAASLWYAASSAAAAAGEDPSAMLEAANGAVDSTRGGWPMVFTVLFFVLLFLPTPDSTPQALHVLQLVSRTVVFASLFAASEFFDGTLHYTRWIGAYNSATSELLEGTQMALGRVVRRPLLASTAERTRDNEELDRLAPPPPAVVAGDVARSFSLLDAVARWGVVVRSAWVLVASAEVHHLALLQLLLVLGLVARMRLRARSAVANKAELLRLQSPLAAAAPLQSPPPATAAPAMAVVVAAAAASVTAAAETTSKSSKKEKKSSRHREKKNRTAEIGDDNSGSGTDDNQRCSHEYLASQIPRLPRDDSPPPPAPMRRTESATAAVAVTTASPMMKRSSGAGGAVRLTLAELMAQSGGTSSATQTTGAT